MKRIALFTIAAMACMAIATTALAVPQVLQYQGRLTDAAGEPLTAPVTVVFSLYAEEDGGDVLWSQTFTNLALDHGRFNVLLGGEDAPFTPQLLEVIQDGDDLFLGIKVGADPEMSPRQAIASVAYGLHAAAADTAGYAEEAGFAEEAGSAETAAVADSVAGLPGVAYFWQDHFSVSVGAKSSVASIDLEITEPGYIIVTASGTLTLDNVNGTGATAAANIGESRNASPEVGMGYISVAIDATDLKLVHYSPFTCQRVYAKGPGTYDFHLNVYNKVGSRKVIVEQPSITAVFVPNAVGTAEDLPVAPATSAILNPIRNVKRPAR